MTAPVSYGDVTGEYLALRRDAAVVAGTHELVWVRGPDAITFLDGLLSQAIAEIAEGGVARSLLLTPQGKLRAVLWVVRAGQDIGLVADLGIGDDVVADLTRFKIRVDATIDTGPQALASLIGPGAEAALGRAGVGGFVVSAPFPDGSPSRYLVGAEGVSALTESGVAQAGAAAATAVRIEAGEPRMGVDIDDRTIPQEAGVVDGAVSFTKGCYLGQELVARIDSRGHVNRHLRGIVVGSNVLPPSGAEVVHDGGAVGTITSVGESLDLRAPVALGLIRREVEPGAVVMVRWDGGEAAATVKALPLIG